MKRLPVLVPPLLGVALSIAANVDDGWRNLQSVTRGRSYAVLLRDSRCVQGRLLSADDDSLQIRAETAPGGGQPVVIQRSQVLRVGEYRNAPSHDAVFSGRSSWSDVKAADPKASEYLSVITKQGQELRWKKPTVSDNSIAGGGRTALKTDIRSVSYIRFKPVSDSEEYNWRETAFFNWPFFWLRQHTLAKIPVPVFDSSVQEDNSPAICK